MLTSLLAKCVGRGWPCSQMLLSLLDFELYCIEEGSPEHAAQVAALREEALALLRPSARHENIVKLLGVIVEEGAHRGVKSLVFELADEGSLDKHIQRLLAPPDGRCVVT